MSADQKVERLRQTVAEHACAIEALFNSPVKVTIIVRNPAVPSGDRDCVVSSDDLRAAVAAVQRLERACPDVPAGGLAMAPPAVEPRS